MFNSIYKRTLSITWLQNNSARTENNEDWSQCAFKLYDLSELFDSY